jgi:hypothetical protein
MTDQQDVNSAVDVSGGVNVNSQRDTAVQGDIVGRDKISINVVTPSAGGVTCPIDHHPDMIQKVSAIMAESQASLLSRQLMLPAEPTLPSHLGGASVASVGSMAVGIGTFLFVGWLLMGGKMITAEQLIISLVVAVIVYFITLSLTTKMLVSDKRSQDKANYETQHLKWGKMKDLWSKSYYCRRHDVVFIVGQQETTAPDRFHSFLSNNTRS